jgi:hypothetical protein
LLPKKPVLASSARVRRSTNEDHTASSDDREDSIDGAAESDGHSEMNRSTDRAKKSHGSAPESGDQAEVTADESGSTGGEDHRSPSPAPQGASRTQGGHFRGQANGNASTFADNATREPVMPPLMGRVVLYDNQAADAVPIFAVKQPVANELGLVLSALASKYSPVRSMFRFASLHNLR